MKKFALRGTGSPGGLSSRLPVTLMRFARQFGLIPLLLPLFIFAGVKLYLHLAVVAVVESTLATLPDNVQFDYDQIDSHFDGTVDIQGASLLLEGMSLPLRFDRFQLLTDSWRQLPLAAEGLEQGELPAAVRIAFSLPDAELEYLAAAKWLPVDTARMLLGCFQPVETTAEVAPSQAVTLVGSFDYQFDSASEYLSAQFQLAGEQRFRVDIKTDLDIGGPQLSLAALDTAGLGGAEIGYFNLGSQSEMLRQCGAVSRSGLVEGSYVARQSKVVKHRLMQQGWMASTELELAYQDYLFLPVQLQLQLTAPQAVNMTELSQSSASWGPFSVRIGLNNSQPSSHALYWQPDANQLAAAPVAQPKLEPPAIESTTQKQPIAARKALINDTQLKRQLDRTVVYQPSYKPVSVRELSGLLGSPLKLTTLNGRRIEGVLDGLGREQLQLRREISHGVAVVPVRLDIISGVKAYF
ncbi:MAG: hypothetical protein V7752_07990 [Halopseudomonas sp.]